MPASALLPRAHAVLDPFSVGEGLTGSIRDRVSDVLSCGGVLEEVTKRVSRVSREYNLRAYCSNVIACWQLRQRGESAPMLNCAVGCSMLTEKRGWVCDWHLGRSPRTTHAGIVLAGSPTTFAMGLLRTSPRQLQSSNNVQSLCDAHGVLVIEAGVISEPDSVKV